MKMPVFRYPRKMWRFRLPVVSFLLLVAFFQLATRNALAEDALNKTIKLDIQENSQLEDALIEWGTKAGMTVMINTPTVSHHVSHGVHGTLSAREALLAILQDSGLSYTQEGDRIQIVPAATIVRSVLRDREQRSLWPEYLGLTSDATGSEASSAADETWNDRSRDQSETRPKNLEVVIVTAEKREERLLDVPIPVSLLKADNLIEDNKLGLIDYFTEIPSLTDVSQTYSIPPSQVVAIRGLSSFAGGPTTAVVVDDLPLLVSGLLPDLDPASLSHIEVLRGPQGTLYGASSIGGLIKYVSLDPSTSGISGNFLGGTDTIDHGSGVGYTFRGGINLPLGGDWATRISAFATKQPGYIDNPALGINGINESHSEGGHLATLWKPTETLSLRLSVILQRTYAGAPTFSNLIPNASIPSFPVPVGDFQQVGIKQIPYETKQQIYGAVLKDKIGILDLTAVSGYVVNSFGTSTDFSVFNSFTQPIFSVAGLPFQEFSRVGSLSQEVRISGAITPHVDFLLGGFYNYQDSNSRLNFPATDPVTGAVAGLWGYEFETGRYSEYAGFANVTFHATQQFDIQVGVRDSQIRQWGPGVSYSATTPSQGTTFNQALNGASDQVYVIPNLHSYNNAVTYLIAPSYKVSPNLMTYLRVATGFRPGGPNTSAPGVSPSYQPDTTTDYDLGVKAELLNHRLSLDVSAFYIDWKNIQITLVDAEGIGYVANAGVAKSQGVELSVEARPVQNLKLASWVDWNDAVFKEPFPIASGLAVNAGDPLPWVPRFSAHFSADQEFPLPGGLTGFVGGQVGYTGDRKDNLQGLGINGSPPIPRIDLPAFAKVDVHGGAKYGAWTVNVYANNVTNRLIRNSGGPQFFNGITVFLPPRTIGANLSRLF